jgi:hypothetical protein
MNRSHAVLLSPLVFAIYSLLFVPLASAGTCTDSTPNSVNICMPQNNFTINGPVELSAAANVTNLSLMRVYDNNVPLYETPMSSFDTFLYLGSGLHQIRVIAYDGTGTAFQKDTSISVTNGSAGQPCGIPQTDATINFCYPTSGLTVGSPVTISALARWDCCTISHIRLYLDNKDVWDADYPTSVCPASRVAGKSLSGRSRVGQRWQFYPELGHLHGYERLLYSDLLGIVLLSCEQ